MRFAIALVVVAACQPRADHETQCHEVVEHLRKVSAMPMREGDVAMLMGACGMWKQPMLDCMAASTSDADVARCREMEHPAR